MGDFVSVSADGSGPQSNTSEERPALLAVPLYFITNSRCVVVTAPDSRGGQISWHVIKFQRS